MTKTDCFQLGYIAKLHGFKGEVSLFLDVSEPEKYKKLDKLYIEINQQLQPFFVERMKMVAPPFAIIKLQQVDSDEQARKLLRKGVFLPAEALPELDDKHFYDHEIIGFTAVDANAGTIGEITDVIELGKSVLLQVDRSGKEVLIPMMDGLVQKVDRKARRLHIQAPEGLLDIYL